MNAAERTGALLGGYIAVFGAALMWAAGGLLVRFLQNSGLAAMSISFLRLSMAWLMLTVWIALTDRRLFRAEPRDVLAFAALGLIGPAGSQPLFIWSVTLTTVAVAAILNYTSPVFVAVMSWLFLGERITKTKLAALALTTGGLVLVTGVYRVHGGVSAPALITGLGSGFLYGTYTMLLKKTVAGRHPLTVQWWAMLFGMPAVLLYSRHSLAAVRGGLGPKAVAALVGNALGPGFLAFILFSSALQRVQASRASIVATAEPAAAALLGFLVIGERLGPAEAVGILLVIAGVALVTGDSAQAAPAREPGA